MQKHQDIIMSSRPRAQSSVMRGSRMRNIAIIAGFTGVLFLLYLLSDANQKWTMFQIESEKCQQRRDSLSAQLQVTFEHKSRLDKALQEEKSQHVKTRDDFNNFKQLQQNIREKDQDTSQKRISSLQQQVTSLQNQNEDLQKENENLNTKYQKLLDDNRDTENDLNAQLRKRDIDFKRLIDQFDTISAEKADLVKKVTELKSALKESLAKQAENARLLKPEVEVDGNSRNLNATNKALDARGEGNVHELDNQNPGLPEQGDTNAIDSKLTNQDIVKDENPDGYFQRLAANKQDVQIGQKQDSGNRFAPVHSDADQKKITDNNMFIKDTGDSPAAPPVDNDEPARLLDVGGVPQEHHFNVLDRPIPPKSGDKFEDGNLETNEVKRNALLGGPLEQMQFDKQETDFKKMQGMYKVDNDGGAEKNLNQIENKDNDQNDEYDEDGDNKNDEDGDTHNEPETLREARYQKFRDWNEHQVNTGEDADQPALRRPILQNDAAEEMNEEVDGVRAIPH